MIKKYVENDKNRILEFLSDCMNILGRIGYFHPGDFIWRTYFGNPGFVPEKDIALYFDDSGALSGFAGWKLQELGAKTLFVATPQSNTPAIKLYEKIGFNIAAIDRGWMKRLTK